MAGSAPYFNNTTPAPPPNFIAFTTTDYVQPTNNRANNSNTFNDLFPGYKPSLSTEETHGRFRAPPPAPRFNSASGCQFQNNSNNNVNSNVNNNSSNVTSSSNVNNNNKNFSRTYQEDVKPVYIQQTTQPQQPGQFLQTISSPATSNGLRGHPTCPPGGVLLTTQHSAPPPNQIITTPSTYHPATTPNVMVTSSQTPNVMVTTPANVIVMGQPGYVSNFISPNVGLTHQQHQVPNVTLRSVPVHAEEPVVGMPVSTGYTEQALNSIPVSSTFNQQPAPPHHLNSTNNLG